MTAPKTWLSAIVREDGLYVQAFIFSCDNGYIANSHIVLTNKENDESTIYQMASGDETCLFKYVNKLTPDVSTNYSIQLVVNAYIYSESDIITFLDTVEFTTPDSWREGVGGDYVVTIEPIVAVGNLSTKPTVRSVISGGEFKDGMRLRICAANSLSTTLDYNSSDAMADFALEDGIYVYNNIFGLGVSGKWYFKAFLALQNNNIISTSNTFEYNVNQGDIEIENLIVGDNVSVVESGTPYVSNQFVDGLGTIGFFSIVDNNSLQIGDTYFVNDNPVDMSLDQYINGHNSFRVATMQEIQNYSQLCDFGSIYTGSNHKSYVVSSEKDEYGYRAWSVYQINGEYGLGHPTTINGVDPTYAILLLTPFENRLVAPGSLDIVALKGGNKIQGTGYKITDIVKQSEFKAVDYELVKKLERIPAVGDKIDGFECVKILYKDRSDVDLFSSGQYAAVFIAFDKIEECNYERAEELCKSLSAEPIPVYKYPNILGVVNMMGHAENIMWSGFTPPSSSTSLCYVKETNEFKEVDYNKANLATVIPCRIIVGERYVRQNYSKLNELGFSVSENEENRIKIDDCEEVMISRHRVSDGAVVNSINVTLDNDGFISLLYLFPRGSEIVGVEYRFQYWLVDDINVGTYYEIWIDEFNSYGSVLGSEFALTINTI